MNAQHSPDDPPWVDPLWVDDAAGPLVRQYAITSGRTRPSHDLDLLSTVMATRHAAGEPGRRRLGPEHTHALTLCRQCRQELTVATAAARLGQPITVTKIILSDLIDLDLVTASPPGPTADPADLGVLEVIARGLRNW
jgi:Protein of unknown function (DUF742)